MTEVHDTEPGTPQPICPGCGSRHVEHERGLLFCGTCGATVAVEDDGPDLKPLLTPEQERRRAFRASLRSGGSGNERMSR